GVQLLAPPRGSSLAPHRRLAGVQLLAPPRGSSLAPHRRLAGVHSLLPPSVRCHHDRNDSAGGTGVSCAPDHTLAGHGSARNICLPPNSLPRNAFPPRAAADSAVSN